MSDDTQHYCQCVNVCIFRTRLETRRFGYSIAAFIFGFWFIASTSFMVATFRERCQLEGALPVSPPLLPSIFSVLQNRMFCILLPAWICDSIGAGNILLCDVKSTLSFLALTCKLLWTKMCRNFDGYDLILCPIRHRARNARKLCRVWLQRGTLAMQFSQCYGCMLDESFLCLIGCDSHLVASCKDKWKSTGMGLV